MPLVRECKKCNFKTTYKNVYDAHLLSQKYIYFYICDLCGKKYKTKALLIGHKKNSKIHPAPPTLEQLAMQEKKRERDLQGLTTLMQNLIDMREVARQANKKYDKFSLDIKTIADDGAILINRTTALIYAAQEFSSAPILTDMYDDNLQNKITSSYNHIRLLVNAHDNKTLRQNICGEITMIYKKSNSYEQSLWNTNINFPCYIVRQKINKNIMWTIDIESKMVIKLLVNPVIKCICVALLKEMNSCINYLENHSIPEKDLPECKPCAQFSMQVENNLNAPDYILHNTTHQVKYRNIIYSYYCKIREIFNGVEDDKFSQEIVVLMMPHFNLTRENLK
jgi:hypothetical protein